MRKIGTAFIALAPLLLGSAACPAREQAAAVEEQPVTPGPAAASALCKPVEQVIFECGLGERTVAICAGGSGETRYVQYRYGTADALELQHPAQPFGSGTLAWSSTPYSGGGEAQISFDNGAYTYVVYSRTVRTGFGEGGNAPEFSAGLFVQRDGRTISRKSCTDPAAAEVDIAAAQELLPPGAFRYDD
ncbi:hypothetical protein [Sphingosinithalassobacter sp. LHW66-3]|uniref:hypothetical protein n=1 Tax=Sphingosinithalassobacter sp. LHW66-3 TaxID=3424718 RepID=UPI003D6A1B67